jgi:hypothetical protein
MEEMTAYDEAFEEGFARGLAAAEARGQAKMLLAIARGRFGHDPSPAVERQLLSIRNVTDLDRIVDRLFIAETWDELFA